MRSCLLGEPYEVVKTPLGFTIKEVGNGKFVRYGFDTEADANSVCKQMNDRAFIEEEREAKCKLEADDARAEYERECDGN